jgi:hypothetical protein
VRVRVRVRVHWSLVAACPFRSFGINDAVDLQLAGLSGAVVADLVAAPAGGKPDGSLLRLADGAAGNSLYVTELVAALGCSPGLPVTEAGVAKLAAVPHQAHCRRP